MSLKLYEMVRLGLEPFLLPLHKQVRAKLGAQVKTYNSPPAILDVGGRKSPYTIGIPAQITIIDLPRESEIQHEMNLGIDNHIIKQMQRRRSNVKAVVFGDMTCSNLPNQSFDQLVAVGVLEHIEQDDLFVKEVSRVLKADGIFLMTTPNGDWVENKNPDHKRHYKKRELNDLLSKYFAEVSVEYAVIGGRFRRMGLNSWSLRHPLKTASSIFGNLVNSIQSANGEVRYKADGTHHLIAVAKKPSLYII